MTKTTTDSYCGQCRQARQFWRGDLNHAVAVLQRERLLSRTVGNLFKHICNQTVEVDIVMSSVHKTFSHDLPCPIWRKYLNLMDVLLKCVGVSRDPWNCFLSAHQSSNFCQCLKWPAHDQWVPSSWLLCWHSRIMDILRASGRTTSLRKIQQLVAKATMDGAWWRYTTHKRPMFTVGIYRRYAGFLPILHGCRFVPCTFFRKQIHRWYLSIQNTYIYI